MWIYGEFCCTWITWAIIRHSNRKHIRRIFLTFVGHSNIFKYCKRIFFRDYFISRFNWKKNRFATANFREDALFSTVLLLWELVRGKKCSRRLGSRNIFPPRINFGLQYLGSYLECLNDLLQVVLEWKIDGWCRVLEWIIDRWCRVRYQCFVTRIRISTTGPNLVSLYYNIHVYLKPFLCYSWNTVCLHYTVM